MESLTEKGHLWGTVVPVKDYINEYVVIVNPLRVTKKITDLLIYSS